MMGKGDALLCIVGFVCGSLWISIIFLIFFNNSTPTTIYITPNTTSFCPPPPTPPPPSHLDTLNAGLGLNYTGLGELVRVEKFRGGDPVVCVVIRTYHRHRGLLPALIASLASNEYPNMYIHIVDTQGDYTDLPKFEPFFNTLYNRDLVHVSRSITPQYARERFPNFTRADFGYLLTDLMIEQLSAHDHPHKCQYYVATNGDNLYSSDFMALTVEYMRNDYGLIGFHFLSHYCYDHGEPHRPREGCYSSHYTEFRLQRIDVGAALFSNKSMHAIHNNFILNELEKDSVGTNIEVYFLDGYFYDRFAKAEPKNIVLNATLFLHQ